MPTSGAAPVLGRMLVAVALYTLTSWLLIGAAIVAWAPGRSLAASAVSRAAGALSGASPSAAIIPIAMDGVIMNCADDDVSTYGFEDNSDDQFSWGLLDGDGDGWVGGGDWRTSQKSTKKGGPRFWFREDGKEYVVRDPAIVAEVRAAVRPLNELGRQMGAVGGEMGRNGARMGHIGGRLGAVGARLGLIEARLAQRAARRGERVVAETSMKELRAEMDALRAQLDQENTERSGQQRELSRRMSELSAKQQAAMKDVRQKIRELAARARREGKAERPHANA